MPSMNFNMLPKSCWFLEMYFAFAYGETTISGTRKPINIAASPLRTIHQHLRRRNVIVPASPIVPHNEDRRVPPIRAVANRVHHRRHPRGPLVAVDTPCVIRRLTRRNHPTHVRQLLVGNVPKDLRLIEDHMVSEIRSPADATGGQGSANMLDRLRSNPERRACAARIT